MRWRGGSFLSGPSARRQRADRRSSRYGGRQTRPVAVGPATPLHENAMARGLSSARASVQRQRAAQPRGLGYGAR